MKIRRLLMLTGIATGALLSSVTQAQAPGAPGPAAPPPAAPTTPAVPPATSLDGGTTERALPDRAPPQVEGVEPEPGGLTASEVSRRAISIRPSLKQKRAELRAADEKITQTMIQFFPRLTIQAGYTRLSSASSSLGGALVGALNAGQVTTACPPGQATGCAVVDAKGVPIGAQAFNITFPQDNYVVSGRLTIPLSDYVLRISGAAAATRASREAARISVEAERLKVDADSRALYFNWLRARGQASIARKSVEQTRARLEDARASFNVGAISKAELLRIEALVANTELVLTRSESMVSLTTGQLAIVMEDWHPNYRVGEGIPLPESIPEEHEPLDHLIAAAQARRLEMHAVDESIRALRHGADSTRAGALPHLDAVGDLTAANPNQRYFPPQQVWHTSWSAGLLASWTVGDTFLNSAAARELEQNAIAMEARRTELKAGIALEVLSAYLDLGRARAGLSQQRTALDAAEEAYRVTTDLFRAGRATGTDLIDSESGLLNAKLGEVDARIDLTVAAIALRHATGRDVTAAGAEAKN